MHDQMIDVLILNRNMREVTDKLATKMLKQEGVKFVGVIDSGSRSSEISSFTFAKNRTPEVIENGLRPNRGFHLGLLEWNRFSTKSDWILLLPNDSELVNWNPRKLLESVTNHQNIAVIIPLSPENPYSEMLGPERISVGWNFHEGPILLNRIFIEDRLRNQGYVLDPNNFRGYLSFMELALQIYANDLCILGTDLISFSENQSHTLNNFNLIGTEPISQNLEKLISEGELWLLQKHGLMDRWAFEMLTRLAFEEFCKVHPDLMFPPLV
jgi:hypothetical protein